MPSATASASFDAAFAPAFRYFEVLETIDDFGFSTGLPKGAAWRAQLAQRPSVRDAVGADYPLRLAAFPVARRSALSRRMSLRGRPTGAG